jgi:glutathione S-transferase
LALSPKGTVPVLVLQDRVLEQSLDIMQWALSQHDPEGWLTEAGNNDAEAHQLVERCDLEFKVHLDRYKYPSRFSLSDGLAHRTEGAIFLQTLDEKLSQSDFLMGPTFTWVDAAILPFVRQFARTDRAWFDVQSWQALRRWLELYEHSDAYATVMHSYKVWHPGAKPVAFPS